MSDKPNFDSVGDPNTTQTSESIAELTETTNEAGGVAYEPTDERVKLFKVVINNILEDSYYDTVEESFDKVWDAFDSVADTNPEFVLQLAAYARHEEGLRDIPQLLLVLAANDERITQPDEHTSLVRDYTPAIIDRTDEFNTVLSYQLDGYGKPVPKGLQKGIEDALHEKYAIVEVYEESSDDEPIDTVRVTFVESEYDDFRDVPDGAIDGVDTTHRARDRAHYRAIESATDADEFAGVTQAVDEGYVHDEYTFTRHQQNDKDVSLRDVLNLVRPNPRSEERNVLFESITKGELSEGVTEKDHWTVEGNFPPEDVEPLREERTWESEMSEDDDRSDAEKFRDRLDDMGLMARVRNLRNMREAGLSGAEIFDYDGGEFGPESERLVEDHQMFPFRFYQAYRACSDSRWSSISGDGFTLGTPGVLDETSSEWLSAAIDVSANNLPDELENTFTAIDLSGSMDRPISDNSSMARAEIATLFGATLTKRSSDVGVFGSDFSQVTVPERTRSESSTLEIAQQIYDLSDRIGNSTNGWKALRWAIDNEQSYDRFVYFTDEQLWDSTSYRVERSLKELWDDYVSRVNPDADLYIVDTASHGTFSMPDGYDNVHHVSGWSSNVIDYIATNESMDDMIDAIAAIGNEDY